MSYAMQWLDGLGTAETNCREAGGLWNPHTSRCEGLARRQCENQGGRWDDAALVCAGLPGGTISAADMCKKSGGRWDYDLRVCVPRSGGSPPGPNGGRPDAAPNGDTLSSALPLGIGIAVVGTIWLILRKK